MDPCTHLIHQSRQLLGDLQQFLAELDNTSYSTPVRELSGSSLGQHCRHVLEFYDCLLSGQKQGYIDYDLRQRELRIEQDKHYAGERIGLIIEQLNNLADAEEKLILLTDLDRTGNEKLKIPSSLARELVYNIEHCIHHMALIRVAAYILLPELHIPAHFGVAPSTLRYRQLQN